MPNSHVILGIDPGLADTGFGVIRKNKSTLEVLEFGTIKTSAKNSTANRLLELSKNLETIIARCSPSTIAIEKLFFCKNVTTAIAVGQARGVVLLAAGKHNLKVTEYTPLQVKQALTGYGKAPKNQVKEMVKIVLHLSHLPKSDDAADALAIATCCAQSARA